MVAPCRVKAPIGASERMMALADIEINSYMIDILLQDMQQ
jgi:hypothetical protein